MSVGSMIAYSAQTACLSALCHMQLMLVVGGLVVRSAASGQLSFSSLTGAGSSLADACQFQGAIVTLASALTYSVLNLLYDYTVQTTENPPAHPVIMSHMARIGLLANGLYTAAFTLPNWDKLVGAHLAHSQRGTAGAAALLLGFGALYNVHGIVQVRKCTIACASWSPALHCKDGICLVPVGMETAAGGVHRCRR